ncbi:MAG: DUF4199 domain-containing protein, partial [Bacteroidota bacterium]
IPLLFLGLPGPEDFKNGEIVGYSAIVISMIFVFLGIRQYREIENGGHLGFWEAVKIGLGIAAFPAIAFGLYNLFYTEVLDPEFFAKYTEYLVNEQADNKTAAELETLRTELIAQNEVFDNPLIQFGTMFLSVFLIGLIVSILSAFILKRETMSGMATQ